MLSATADHALRAVLFLARQSPAKLVSSDEIATAIGAPRNYLSKILYDLAKAGVVSSSAGRAGGFALANGAIRLSLATIIDRFDGEPPSSRCLLGDGLCNAAAPCAAHERWSAVRRSYRAALESTTIAQLAGIPL